MVNSIQTGEVAGSTMDPLIQRLLTKTINSSLKLHLVLLFHENPWLEGSAYQIIQRIYRDIWSTREALRELANDGVLDVVDRGGEPIYRYHPRPEYRAPIACLVERFNDPFAREEIQAVLHGFASHRVDCHGRAGGMAEEACACGCPVLYDSISFTAS